jgi:hypothetical protein
VLFVLFCGLHLAGFNHEADLERSTLALGLASMVIAYILSVRTGAVTAAVSSGPRRVRKVLGRALLRTWSDRALRSETPLLC